jgi:hypothetical protein
MNENWVTPGPVAEVEHLERLRKRVEYLRGFRAGIEAAAIVARRVAHERCMKGQTAREVSEEVQNAIYGLKPPQDAIVSTETAIGGDDGVK